MNTKQTNIAGIRVEHVMAVSVDKEKDGTPVESPKKSAVGANTIKL
jgi:hypothetical protein